ncbi:acyloxyacyl hydrolase [Halomonas organivorans]
MRPVSGFPHPSVSFGLAPVVLCGLLAPSPSYADDWELQSLSLRARVSEKTLLGKEAPEDFKEYDLSANVALPWEAYSTSGWGMGTRLMASAGVLRGAGENALVVSLIPEWTLGSEDGRFLLDLGAGAALFSRHRFGEQDFGGPFQFALTVGVGMPLYRYLGVGYRFLHYSDAGVNGSDTTGADFHMIEFRYRF